MLHMRNITVATDLSNLPSRNFLTGVLQYVHDKPDWRLRVLQSPQELTARVIYEIDADPSAGLITTEIPSAEVADALSSSQFPLVLVGTRKIALLGRTRNIVQLSINEMNVGHLATEHLLSFGRFRCCVFVPARIPSALVLSTLREQAFVRRCTRANIKTFSFREVSDADFVKRLASLPRPIAILTETVERGRLVLQAANQIGLEIPAQLALITIESDSLVCMAATPSLTNVYPDATGEGLEAARKLDTLLRQKNPGPRTKALINVPIVIKNRETTSHLSPATALVQRATELIEKEAMLFTTAEDLAARLGVSRRLLDLRLRTCQQQTASELLRNAKLSAFAERLRESSLPIEKLAAECGFSNAAYLQTLFKRVYEMTPGAYRHAKLTS